MICQKLLLAYQFSIIAPDDGRVQCVFYNTPDHRRCEIVQATWGLCEV